MKRETYFSINCLLKKFLPTHYWKTATKTIEKNAAEVINEQIMRHLFLMKFWWIQWMDSNKRLNPKL